jgi:hypothetical protein
MMRILVNEYYDLEAEETIIILNERKDIFK